ncbi:hypothetical protein K431DRAFT_288258 [Polychaeton citri CBS 116435]|uniref:Uncharacterized protein n=1 Tax=Polychaeton citri CBS 116435 TaxID=1314669 RepID=A0A9P4Q3L3_9PEZI|nr:hypothetical protein K431DRAFT_288258 [Polychaeton citri CBS 116435]
MMHTHPQAQGAYMALLPAELRTYIYKLALPEAGPVYTSYQLRHSRDHDYRPSILVPALAQTCRQIRHEVFPILLGGANPVRVEINPNILYDTVYLERFIEGLGENVRYVRRLEIRHKIDFYFMGPTERVCDFGAISSAATTFTVAVSASGGLIDQACPSITTALHPLDQGFTLCDCPVSSRFLSDSGALRFSVQTPLTRAVAAFLELMDRESLPQDRVSKALGWHRRCHLSCRKTGGCSVNYPACGDCGKRIWFLQGPPSSAKRTEDGLEDDEVMYEGFKWKWCPFLPVPTSAKGLRSR